MCVRDPGKRKEVQVVIGYCWLSEKEWERWVKERTDLNYPPSLILWRRQLSTSAVILSSPRLTKHLHENHVAHVPPSTWYYSTTLTQLAFHAVTPFWDWLTQPSDATGSSLSLFLFDSFTPDRIITCLEVSQGAPILVFACVCSNESLLLTYIEQQTSLPRLSPLISIYVW